VIEGWVNKSSAWHKSLAEGGKVIGAPRKGGWSRAAAGERGEGRSRKPRVTLEEIIWSATAEGDGAFIVGKAARGTIAEMSPLYENRCPANAGVC